MQLISFPSPSQRRCNSESSKDKHQNMKRRDKLALALWPCANMERCSQAKSFGWQVLAQAGAHAKEEVCRTLVVHISNAPNLHAYAGRQAYKALQENQGQASLLLLTTTAWLLGRIWNFCFKALFHMFEACWLKSVAIGRGQEFKAIS